MIQRAIAEGIARLLPAGGFANPTYLVEGEYYFTIVEIRLRGLHVDNLIFDNNCIQFSTEQFDGYSTFEYDDPALIERLCKAITSGIMLYKNTIAKINVKPNEVTIVREVVSDPSSYGWLDNLSGGPDT